MPERSYIAIDLNNTDKRVLLLIATGRWLGIRLD